MHPSQAGYPPPPPQSHALPPLSHAGMPPVNPGPVHQSSGYGPSAYTPPYPQGPGSMHTPSSGMSDPSGMNDVGTPRLSPTHQSIAAMSAQKRAYRQRRKDPSCDACRERKVKCDATDASSCSECSSRSVKCQFTKETNRRMSSMKQVQDLERQLHQARQQIGQLKGMLQDNGQMAGQAGASSVLNIPDGQMTKERAQAPRAMSNFFKVRRNIRNYGRGIFKPPPAYRTLAMALSCTDAGPELPPRQLTESLLLQYKHVLHRFRPMLHWPTFQNECDALYRAGSFRGQRKIWIAVFFGVLACSTLLLEPNSGVEADGRAFVDTSIRNINTMSDEVSIDHARATCLVSVYFMESNLKSAAWIWNGASVRSAQEAGLHYDHGSVSQLQSEMRKRTWWSVYNWDRFMCLELGCPPAIADPDMDVSEPTPVDDDCIGPNGIQQPPPTGQNSAHILMALVPVSRVVYQVKKSLRAQTITASTLSIYDDHFTSIMDSLPDPYPIHSATPLDPMLIHPALYLQIVRLMLYRHNLAPFTRPQERQDALHRCVQVAKDTAHYIWRTTPSAQNQSPRSAVHPPDFSNPEWKSRVRAACGSFMVTHLWRCILVLALCGEYGTALTCVGVMSATDNQKKVNLACGRNLAFFLDRLMQKLQVGRAADLQTDEEMLAYASADMQGCHDSAWAWLDSDSHGSVSSASPTSTTSGEPFGTEPSVSQPVLLTKDEEQEWGGFTRVEDMLRQLQYGQHGGFPDHHQRAHQTSYPRSAEEQRPSFASAHQMSPYAQPPQPAPPVSHLPPPHHRPNAASQPPVQHIQQQHQHQQHAYPGPPTHMGAAPPALRSPFGMPGPQPTQSTPATPGPNHTSTSTSANPVSRISIKDIM